MFTPEGDTKSTLFGVLWDLKKNTAKKMHSFVSTRQNQTQRSNGDDFNVITIIKVRKILHLDIIRA